MSEPSRDEVEAAAKALCEVDVRGSWVLMGPVRREPWLYRAKTAIEAAAKVKEGRERRIAYNGTGEEEYARVLMHEDETLQPGEELVIRPIGGKEQKA